MRLAGAGFGPLPSRELRQDERKREKGNDQAENKQGSLKLI